MFKRKEFERVIPEQVGIDSKDIEWLIDQLESGYTEPHGLMIMRHGKICAEGWWSPYAPGIRHGEQSHSKTYAGTAIGIAYTEGLLSLEEKVTDIFPEYLPDDPSEYLRKMTIRDLLCMGCGMDVKQFPTKNWIRDFFCTPVNHLPGTAFMYNNMASCLLGAIIKKKTGLGLHEYLKTRLYDKIGIMSDNHKWVHLLDGIEAGGAGLYATTEDNLRLMKLYADGGIWEGEQILAPDYVLLATSKRIDTASERKVNPPAEDNFVGYGYQMWMCRPEGVYRADGAMGQFTIVVPDMDMIIAITENANGGHWAQKTLDTMWKFLDRIRNNIVESGNSEAADRLYGRLRRLSLPSPIYRPYSPLIREINDRKYRVMEGQLFLQDYMTGYITAGIPAGGDVKDFSFRFGTDHALFRYRENGEDKEIKAAIDGSRIENEVSGTVPTKVLVNGYWKSSTCFEMVLRWIETCFEQKINFNFSEKKVELDISRSITIGEDPIPVTAVLNE